MSERSQLDDAIDEAIDELIDEQTSGFHLVTSKREAGGIKQTQTWYDDPVEITVSEDLDVFSSTFALYCMADLYLTRLREEHGKEVDMIDVFQAIMAVHEKSKMESRSIWEYNSLEGEE